MEQISLSGLFIYPIKSLAGIASQQCAVDRFGLSRDRRWMLIDTEGRFLSQRQLPRMTLIKQQIINDELHLRAPGQRDLILPLTPSGGDLIRVEIWSDECDAWHCSAEADVWFTGFLELPCRLVYMPDHYMRGVDPAYASKQDRTAFSDGFPLLLISEASLEDLNQRLTRPVTMSRFRPNLVVSGCGPYAEDGWSRIRVGQLELRVVKPCSRCVITTIDPATAAKGAEPLKTLSVYRRRGNKVYFGQNLLHDGDGRLTLGMPVEILD